MAKSPPASAPPNGVLQDATGGMLVPYWTGEEVTEDAGWKGAEWAVRGAKSVCRTYSLTRRHRNLCARERLTRNKAGTATEFKAYYDGSSAAERKVSCVIYVATFVHMRVISHMTS